MIIIAGKPWADAVDRDAHPAGCPETVEGARAAEGCRDFARSADLIEPDRINVHERWETEEALARFRGAGPEPAQAARIRDAEVRAYRFAAVEAP
ncbi:antibiotic biosynthesis monooxygenase [Streptomyces diastaticus]|nr:antibiotic biosynthesis monooxygenase [Streptomyces diastaticus]